MSLFTLGLNHQTAPLAVRERIAFSPEALGQALRDLLGRSKVKEAAILSTCNRTEVYVRAEEPAPAVRWLEDFHRVMASEHAQLVPYIQYPDDVPLRQWAELNRNRAWTAIHLVQNGVTNSANARHCPATMALLPRIDPPVIPDRGPNAMFSLLAPGAHIPPHNGVTNTRLVCHLPLIVPSGCWFRVGAERHEWEVGKAWVFDDTIEHEAANPSDSLRVILIVDTWHPDLSAGERTAVGATMAATDPAEDEQAL